MKSVSGVLWLGLFIFGFYSKSYSCQQSEVACSSAPASDYEVCLKANEHLCPTPMDCGDTNLYCKKQNEFCNSCMNGNVQACTNHLQLICGISSNYSQNSIETCVSKYDKCAQPDNFCACQYMEGYAVQQCSEETRNACASGAADGASRNSGGSGAKGFEQQSQFDQAKTSCGSVAGTLEETCNPEKNSWAATAKQTANSLSSVLAVYKATNPAFACSKVGQITKSLELAATTYSTGCTGVIASCRSSCGSALQLSRAKFDWCAKNGIDSGRCLGAGESSQDFKDRYTSCGSYENEAAQAAQSAQSFAVSTAASLNCDKAVGSEDYCQKHSSESICVTTAVDCNKNPSDRTCICRANPRDPSCTSNTVLSKGNINNLDSASRGSRGSNDDNLSDQQKKMMGALDNILQQTSIDPVTGNPGGGVNAIPEGKGRGAPGGGGGGSAGYGAAKGSANAAASSRFNTNVIGKLGGGGSGGRGFGGLGGGGDISGRSMGSASGTGSNGLKPGFDLKAYLPGGRLDPRRTLAGESGPDGITGANGLSLWDKVSRRYSLKRASLLRD